MPLRCADFSAGFDALTTTASLPARVAALEEALREIRETQGKVCGMFEICHHAACRSSYTAWAITDRAFAAPTPPETPAGAGARQDQEG